MKEYVKKLAKTNTFILTLFQIRTTIVMRLGRANLKGERYEFK